MEPFHVKHVEDVIKPQEQHIHGVFFDKAQALWHFDCENRVCWIFHFKKFQVSSQNTPVQTLHIPNF
jgi:hypothetical protein